MQKNPKPIRPFFNRQSGKRKRSPFQRKKSKRGLFAFSKETLQYRDSSNRGCPTRTPSIAHFCSAKAVVKKCSGIHTKTLQRQKSHVCSGIHTKTLQRHYKDTNCMYVPAYIQRHYKDTDCTETHARPRSHTIYAHP